MDATTATDAAAPNDPPIALPGLSFTLWTVRAIVDAGTRLPEPDPSPPLRLPAGGFTLWLNPDRWPQPAHRLPGHATTLWLDPARWPAPRLRLPGAAHTLWLNPDRWPVRTAHPVTATAQPSAPAMPASPIRVTVNRAFTLWTRDAATIELPPAPAAAAATAAHRLPGSAFTVWAHPGRVQPIPMKNDAPAAPRPAAASVAPGPVPVAGPPPSSGGFRWLPIAALLAVGGFLAFKLAGATSERRTLQEKVESLEAGVVGTRNEANKARISLAQAETALVSTKQNMGARIDELTALESKLKEELSAARLELRKSEAGASQASAESGELKASLVAAKKEAAERIAALEKSVAGLTAELADTKRTTGEAAVKAGETISRLEAEKAAAVKAAGEAAARADALQRELDAAKAAAPAPQPEPAPAQ